MHIKIFLYFAIYAFLGWCLESVYKTILEKKPINSGFLYGPFCPIYGFGAIIMIILLQGLKDNIIALFCVSTVVLTIWEYVVGVILEKVFKTKYWDYSDLKFNINGRVCLKNSIYWGILGVIFTLIIHPTIRQAVSLMSNHMIFHMTLIIYIILITDIVISITKVLFIDKKIKQINEMGEMIKEKLAELKQADMLEKVSKENILLKISELKEQQAILKYKIYKLIVRLKKAFPTMQSDTISKFMNQKIELIGKQKDKTRKEKEK